MRIRTDSWRVGLEKGGAPVRSEQPQARSSRRRPLIEGRTCVPPGETRVCTKLHDRQNWKRTHETGIAAGPKCEDLPKRRVPSVESARVVPQRQGHDASATVSYREVMRVCQVSTISRTVSCSVRVISQSGEC